MNNSRNTPTDQRVAAFGEFRRIVAEQRSSKLFDDEAETLLDGASDMMLASDGGEVRQAQESFEAQMDRLEISRWSEMIGTEDQPGTATRLRRAFAGCVPAQLPLAA